MTGGRKRAPNTLGPHFLRSWRGPSHRSHGVVAPDVRTVLAVNGRAYSKRVPRTNCALRIKKCAPRISSGIYFLSTG